MKKKLFIMGGILVVIFVLSLIFIFSYDKKDSSNNSNNNDKPTFSENITKEQNINNIVFTDIHCEFDGYTSLIEYTVINKTESIVNLGEYEIIVKDKNGEILANIVNVLNNDIVVGDSIRTGTSIDIDLTKANSIELVLE